MHDIVREISLGPRRRPRSRRAALMTTGALALEVAVGACGGPSTSGAVTGSTTAARPAGGGSQATGLAALHLVHACAWRSELGLLTFPWVG